ncbi:histidine phosphatase family protein [Marinobacteraceae bacterium S3BR75-40.1]
MTKLAYQHYSVTADLLEKVPSDQPVVVLLRHSIRDELPPDGIGYMLPITEEGKQQGEKLGQILGDRLKTLHSSPLARCLETADALNKGAGLELPITEDRLLGDPGVFVIDGELAWSNWERLGSKGVMRHLITENDALPGMARPGEAAHRLVSHMLAASENRVGMHVFVTHDSLVMATAARLLWEPLDQGAYPDYLEGVFFWQGDGGIHTAYRSWFSVREPTLAGL